ncbi:MAG: Asp-tRNA(Asn)/Glu-tRNA(Gln) amidotransferase subunit GatB [Candidatus Pacearchaeota archaeon]
MMREIKIGLEIHGYLITREKLFCQCRAVRHAILKEIKPNSFICPICTGQPGSKPMLPNAEAIKKVIQISLMLGCEINTVEKGKKLVWQRKHYDWPDLPKGYQITMSGAYSVPLAINGNFNGIRIRECHLEEDPAAWDPETGTIDYNRSGIPLIEIVTEPDFKNGEQVEQWLKQFLLLASYIKALDKSAGIKVDVNVSTGGERVEIKNLSSLESIKNAINYEISRQLSIGKEKIARETRRWDEAKQETIVMRTKELAEDYRFIPDPDLPVLKITEMEVAVLKRELPESPKQKLEKLIKKYKLNKIQAGILASNLELVEFFEEVAKHIDASFALPWITIELLRVLNYNKKTLDEVDIKPAHFVELLELVKSKKITPLKAKSLLNEFIPTSFSIAEREKAEIIEKLSDEEIKKICKEVVEKNKKAVEDYKQGNQKALDFLIGEVMKLSKRRADYKKAKEFLLKFIKQI